MIEGIIYRYVSPSGKSYIGQTTNERHRRNTWFCKKYRYAGPKIDRARLKYGPTNFSYEILHRKFYFNKKDATSDLDNWEIYYIGYFDSYKNGYNSTIGGLSNRGAKRTAEQIENMRLRQLGRKASSETILKISAALKGKKHSLAGNISSKEKRRNSGRLISIYQFDSNGNLLRKWRCASEAAESLLIVDSNIYRATRTLGLYKGYYWRKSLKFESKVKKNCCKTVYQETLNGDLVAVHGSILDAAKSINKLPTLISRCLNGKRDSAYGYIWKFNK